MDDVPATHPDTPHYAGIQKYTHNIMLPRSYNVGIIFNTRIGVGTRGGSVKGGKIATGKALEMTVYAIPHTHVVILNAVKNLVIRGIVSLLLPDPSTPLRCAQDDKGEEFSGRVKGGLREG